MKIKFHCYQCDETFNVHAGNLASKDSLLCPNCSNSFPEEYLSYLREGIELILKAKKMPHEQTSIGYTSRFNFTIED